jgi:RND family efflux transporter MFP subunit
LNEEIAELERKLESDTSYQEEVRATVVRVKDLQPESFRHFIELSGKVEAEEEVYVSPEMNGKVERIYVKEGEKVSRGQLLMLLDTDVTEKSINEVETNLELLRKLYEKQKNLWDQDIGSEVQYLQAKSNMESAEARLASLKEQLDMARVTAPFGGVIENVAVKQGDIAMPGGRHIHLVNLRNLSIETSVSENYLNDIREGEQVEVEFPSYPDMERVLPVKRVGSVIDNLSRTFEVELELDNPDEKIKPNQLASLRIMDFSTDSALIVPSIIIKQDTRGYYLYKVLDGEEGLEAEKVYVVPGRSYSDQTMVVEGIEPGMKIIVDGYNLVSDGTSVRIVD